MKKLLLVAVVGLLAACGGDAGTEVQTYQSLIDAAKSDAPKLLSQIAKNVTVKFSPADFTATEVGDNYILMKHNQSQDPSKAEGLGITFLSSDKQKIEGKTEVLAKCTDNVVQSGMGVVIALRDCQLI